MVKAIFSAALLIASGLAINLKADAMVETEQCNPKMRQTSPIMYMMCMANNNNNKLAQVETE